MRGEYANRNSTFKSNAIVRSEREVAFIDLLISTRRRPKLTWMSHPTLSSERNDEESLLRCGLLNRRSIKRYDFLAVIAV